MICLGAVMGVLAVFLVVVLFACCGMAKHGDEDMLDGTPLRTRERLR